MNKQERLKKVLKNQTLIQKFFGFIWNFTETNNISLGKFAPFVFGKMIGKKYLKK